MERFLTEMMERYTAGDYAGMAECVTGHRPWILSIEAVLLVLLGTVAVGGLWSDPGPSFWLAWHGLAAGTFLVLRWCRSRLAAGVDGNDVLSASTLSP